jgi:phosphoribosylformylglycinamidine synthase subunit PurSL
VIKPLQGRGMVNGDASVFRPVLDSRKGVVLSHGLNPNYSDIDTYHMAASAIDTAVRNALCVGANLDTLALLDNFCWCSSDEPERLGQLKRAAQACYDVAVDYGTPFISGKDSMFNDFKGYDSDGDPIKVSIPPTLLVSSIGVMDDVRNAVSLDAKAVGDSVYVLGNTEEHLGGSEYFDMVGENERGKGYVGNSVPVVDTEVNGRLYRNFSDALDKGLVASAQSVNQGGLLVALAKTAMGGRLGMELDMSQIPGGVDRDDYALFSESQGRIVVTVDPMNERDFQAAMEGSQYSKIGIVRDDDRFLINSKRGQIVDTNVNEMLGSYRSTFEGY